MVNLPVSRSMLTERDVGAEAPGFALGIEECGFLQADFHALRNAAAVGGSGDLAPGDLLIGNAFDGEAAVGLHDVFRRGFDQMRGDAFAFVDYALGRGGQGAAADDRAAAAEGAGALLAHMGVAVENGHMIHRCLQSVPRRFAPTTFHVLGRGSSSR